MRKCFDVLGIGYTALDFLCYVPHLPEDNAKLETSPLEIQGGGPAATATVTAKRLGLTASFIGKMGDDFFGKRMISELESESIDLSSIVIEEGRQSQFAYILINSATASRTILWNRGTLSPLLPGEIDLGLVESCRGLLVDSLEPAAAAAAARRARESGVPVVIDAGTLRDGVEDVLPFCDYIVGSELFASQIAGGGSVEEALGRISGFGPAGSVITLGERGCAALIDGKMEIIDGFEVGAVDTTGAGDVFHGAFIAGVLRGWDLRTTCIFSNAVAALKCLRTGGRAGIPSIAETMRFLGERSPGTDFSAS